MINELKREKRKYGLSENLTQKELNLLSKNYPIQKIIGHVEMLNVKIDLSYKVLIPRYETEEVILKAFEYIKNDSSFKVLDLATGSGFIALAIKKKFSSAKIYASDISKIALRQASKNAQINKLDIGLIHSNWFSNVNQKFNLIICNPPYIGKYEEISESIKKYEPKKALYAKDDGFYFYKKIIRQAPKYLQNEKLLIFELSALHLDKWNEIKNQKTKYNINSITFFNDIANLLRIAIIKFN